MSDTHDFSIDNFWIPLLNRDVSSITRSVVGWKFLGSGVDGYIEAPMALGIDGNQTIPSQNVILVSAPGAVGKTTFASELAHRTNALYVDLSETDAVGGNFVSGGLFQLGIQAIPSLIIDGLDEARMRVTQEAYSDFLKDVVKIVNGHDIPIVLLGRTGAVEDAWVLLNDESVDAPIIEIDYFDEEKALTFVCRQIQKIREETEEREPDRRAASLILSELRKDESGATKESRQFAGYSPVLVAVARRIALPNDGGSENTQRLISDIQAGKEVITLPNITQSILEREQAKLSQLTLSNSNLSRILYSPEEQLNRLCYKHFGVYTEIELPTMNEHDKQIYDDALSTWIDEHPFIAEGADGSILSVFEGLLLAHISKVDESASLLREHLERGTAVNPFFAEFYLEKYAKGQEIEVKTIQGKHLGLAYASIRANLSLGEHTELSIRPDENDEGYAICSIETYGPDESGVSDHLSGEVKLRLSHDDTLILGSPLSEAWVTFNGETVMTASSEFVCNAPINLEVKKLSINAKSLIADNSERNTISTFSPTVHLSADQVGEISVYGTPVCVNGVELTVMWPNSEKHPWTQFSESTPDPIDDNTDEGLRRLKRIIRLFRGNKQGRLAKLAKAIDHDRRTYGEVGEAVLKQLLGEEVLSKEGIMYFLDPDILSEQTGLTFLKIKKGETNDATVGFIQRALKD